MDSLHEKPRTPTVVGTRTALFAAVTISSVAIILAVTGIGVTARLPFVYPMRVANALFLLILAGALHASTSGGGKLPRWWFFGTAAVPVLVFAGVAVRWAQPEPGTYQWFSHFYAALPTAISLPLVAVCILAIASERPSANRLVFGTIAGAIAATFSFCGLLNGLFTILPANAAFEGEFAIDAAACVMLLSFAIFGLASERGRQTGERLQLLAPLLVACVGTIGAFVMWRFLLEERSAAIHFQATNAGDMVRRTLDLELRQLVRQLQQTANDPDPAAFREFDVPPEAEIVWAESKSLRPDQEYLRAALSENAPRAPYSIVTGRQGEPELVFTAPTREGGVRFAAFRMRDFFDPLLSNILASNFYLALVREGGIIYRYPAAERNSRTSAELVTNLGDMNATMWLEPRTGFVRRGGTGALHLTLVMGLSASFLLAFTAYLLHASRVRLAEVQEARAGLELEIEQRRHAEAELDRKATLLQASNTELQEFAHVVSHDLQEPLRSIRGFTQLLGRRYKDQLDSDGHEFLVFINESSVRMNSMIQGLLTYSRLTHTDDHEEVFPLVEAVDWAKGNLAIALEDSDATLEVGELPQVSGNRLQFCQLMQNLIGNAIKYRSSDKPVIRITSKTAGAECIVTVSDNGMGIGPEFQDRIFGLFKRAHGNDYPGAGVGLALCKKIVERHGGAIWVESTLGRGSDFHMRLPVVVA